MSRSPLPEGFKIKLVVTRMAVRNRLDYQLITPSHPDGILITANAGIILSSLLVDYGKGVSRDHLFAALWGDPEDGGPLDWEKVIDVQLCRARRVLRLAGVDFDYGGNYSRNGRRELTLTNLRECEPYGQPFKSSHKTYAQKKATSRAAMLKNVNEVPLAAAAVPSRENAKQQNLTQAKQQFREHISQPLSDLWTHMPRVNAWNEQQGRRS